MSTLNIKQNTQTVSNTYNSTYGAIPPLTTATSGQFLTSVSNGTSWISNPADNVMIVKKDPASLEVKGTVIINGQDLEERLKTIEKVLTIPERDVKLEAKHPKLKELYDEYINALGKYRTFEAIKGDDNDTP